MDRESKKAIYIARALVVVIAIAFYSIIKRSVLVGSDSAVGNRNDVVINSNSGEHLDPPNKSLMQKGDRLVSEQNILDQSLVRARTLDKLIVKRLSKNSELDQTMASLHRQVGLPRFSRQITGLTEIAPERAAVVLERQYREHLIKRSRKQDLLTLSDNMGIDSGLVDRYLRSDEGYERRKKDFNKAQKLNHVQETNSVLVSEEEITALDRQRSHYKTLLAMQIANKLSKQEVSIINN